MARRKSHPNRNGDRPSKSRKTIKGCSSDTVIPEAILKLNQRLSTYDYFIKIDTKLDSQSHEFKLGTFNIALSSEAEVEMLKSCLVFYLYCKESSSSAILYCEDFIADIERDEPFSTECLSNADSDFMMNLHIANFNLHFPSVTSKSLDVDVYINPKMIVDLSYAVSGYCRRTLYRKSIQQVTSFFTGIETEDYEGCEAMLGDSSCWKLYQGHQNGYNPENDHVEVSHELLRPKLRKYQSQAVDWMLKKEQASTEVEAKLHILFTELTLNENKKIFYLKCDGCFVRERYVSQLPCRGGILADQMGLGKTVEVLACILLHPYAKQLPINNMVFKEEAASIECDEHNLCEKETSSNNTLHEEDSAEKLTNFFGCVCGKIYYDEFEDTEVQCQSCGILQHETCVLAYPLDFPENYICPFCVIEKTKKEPIKSSATLIVSPEAILYQWEEEIEKHIISDNLKVFMYHGVKHHKFIDPTFWADYDIVLTSYETFRKECARLNIAHGEKGHSFRHQKKFISLPTPLTAIEWWRIILDEAQRVENACKASEVALELRAINRWCVSGTPIQTSVQDIYGLLEFLCVDPFYVKKWWKNLLYTPFIYGKSDALLSVLNEIMWMSRKKTVWAQLGIPMISTNINELDFSAVERIYYDKQIEWRRSQFLERIKKHGCEKEKLSLLNRATTAEIMLPLRILREACDHFHLVRSGYSLQRNTTMTMPELMKYLLNCASYDCEEAQRKLLMSMNGLAATYFFKDEYRLSCEMYQSAIGTIEDNKENVRVDLCQKIHILHNYARVLEHWEKAESNDGPERQQFLTLYNVDVKALNGQASALATEYGSKCQIEVTKCRESWSLVSAELETAMFCEKPGKNVPWWTKLLQSKIVANWDTILGNVQFMLENAAGASFVKRQTVAHMFRDPQGLLYVLLKLSDELYEAHTTLVTEIRKIDDVPSTTNLKEAISCHLRPTPDENVKCVYCKIEKFLTEYESKLYRIETKELVRPTESDEPTSFQTYKQGTHADSEFEVILRALHTYCARNFEFSNLVQDGADELKCLATMKKEYKLIQNLWLKLCDFVAAMDEIEMAKTPLRIMHDHEEFPPANSTAAKYCIKLSQLQSSHLSFESEVVSARQELRNKLGHLFYLKNLQKAQEENQSEHQSCPVCSQDLVSAWYVLPCGHCFCISCIDTLKYQRRSMSYLEPTEARRKSVRDNIRCPVCRSVANVLNVYFINNSVDKSDTKIEGNTSTKTIAIIKCLLNVWKEEPSAKCLIFSSFSEYVKLLGEALNINKIPFFSIDKPNQYETVLKEFKTSPNTNVLLLGMHHGLYGVNLIEANHVLIAEPFLDVSKFRQAVGRIYRIGQKKPTFIHKFVTKFTIEETLNAIHEADETANFSSADNTDFKADSLSTVEGLIQLFQS
ncbi:E3 ubiquitin-protein ligase SHPRH-like [Uloborus diversus]|uniref:E3 ubiquitin-protein ligase SHPRH-like n=1 Tax=Uloborus diversus TaxID=327109 RepID=UPI002409100E|nr:E3 ubiquitin-protein ligase SHPRH-like [Uloborus diversus]